ncbi:MAG: arginine--tRNA ligase [Nitrospinae bacterium RIFCSPLOWO2_02_FULL_39_110]|nr:MAG: arginine--tRNA ligase [Nitrospinae bacterium RIFCSPHIGHO2_02_39_11]OGV97945.1 MAG: arginine--tRNA ligase [Nitrospinae bacterium RIFCSPHIGHO2_12_FULL_39_42]OGW03063.1 MAG: arginine--tRNA ligase [Nitrospinae bacterium RIFCSPLOWO2_02_39_17]OGW03250.1 MAG: arginine--tRNA ligase [Nitrospinae bacterium RIFCSPHIGHO2_02_FULL_39_82]OGW06305.1 MAG: arginine--tRNA ligase [Nitrospinae bacterium RIFCSPLOWO2_02_FULL_39_110]OGW08537.1 MAG: arginine--tRNA ligase [Nitrospinae bacterium RIFCSPLOWO2_12_F
MREVLQNILRSALNKARDSGDIELSEVPSFTVEKPREARFGDFYTNLAMVIASRLTRKPRDVANLIKNNINGYSNLISKIEIAGPGFINFFMTPDFWLEGLRDVVSKDSGYGSLGIGRNEKVLVEFVSANPTGPLHVGHGRGAVIGDVLSNILKKAGYDVDKEYYINDVGLQMETLGISTLIRYKQILGENAEFPENGYKGDYINDIARDIILKKGNYFLQTTDKESLPFFIDFSAGVILNGIKKDLENFGIVFNRWYSEKSLYEKGMVDEIIKWLKEREFIYEKDSALWLKASAFGDEKDRVVRRGTGYYTYLASDIAYHKEKYERGFKKVINVWGADHHGYIPRIRSAIKALGFDNKTFSVLLVQLVNLKRGGEVISMSTRSGEFTELSHVVKEVGKDAVRFFCMMRSSDSHLDFDLNLAKEQSSENPVYYVQYAHARICNILKQAEVCKIKIPDVLSINLQPLKLSEELSIIKKILIFPELIEKMAVSLEPHLITHYLLDLSGDFHSYYNKYRVISDDNDLTIARLIMVKALGVVIKNSLNILGVTAPEEM